jgi:molybdenum cofactor cytidylyltransferase
MPLLDPVMIRGLIRVFHAAGRNGEGVCVAPVFDGRRGHPVILHQGLFERALRLRGDRGARSLLAGFPLRLVAWRDDSCLIDVDTPEEYARLAQRLA